MISMKKSQKITNGVIIVHFDFISKNRIFPGIYNWTRSFLNVLLIVGLSVKNISILLCADNIIKVLKSFDLYEKTWKIFDWFTIWNP